MQDHSSSTAMVDVYTDNYDSPWKEAVEHYFPEFMQFYFPEAHSQIDWSNGYEFLDQELHALSQDSELGKRFVDKLVKINLLDGAEKWVYIHIEVQGSRQQEFAKRIFVYNYRIFDRYDRPVASMAVLADEHEAWRPSNFCYSVLGSETSIRFPIAKLTDYHDRLDTLLTEENPFAIITAAHILTQRTRKDDQERYKAKQRLVRLLYQRQWDKQRIIDLFTVIDWLMRLPEGLDQQLWYEIEAIEQGEKMRYITSVERFEVEKIRQQGMTQGLEQGLVQGEAIALQRLLRKRFGDIPATIESTIHIASLEQIEQWLDCTLEAKSLDEIFNPSQQSH